MPLKKSILFFYIFLMGIAGFHCGSKNGESSDTAVDSVQNVEIKAEQIVTETTQPPIINITDTLLGTDWVLYVKDSAATISGLNKKLADIYKNQITTAAEAVGVKIVGAPIAWYKSQGLPFYFEAGYVVDAKPRKKLPGKILVKTMGGDSAVVAHFYGPNELIALGYEALSNWVKDHHKKVAGKPYELYVTDPFIVNGDKSNPYRIRTDIFLPHK